MPPQTEAGKTELAAQIRNAKRLSKQRDVPGLLSQLRQAESEHERTWIITLLGKLEDERAIVPIGELLDSEPDFTRGVLAAALARIGSRKATPFLLKLLSDPDRTARTWAAVGLGDLRCEEAVSGLARMLESDVWNERKQAARSLAQIGGSEAAGRLREARARERRPWRRLMLPGP